jgi:hypothetical protein
MNITAFIAFAVLGYILIDIFIKLVREFERDLPSQE